MLRSTRRRRPLLLLASIVASLYIILSRGPPLFTPTRKATAKATASASKWAHSLDRNISAIYHSTSHGHDPKIRQATMLVHGNNDELRPIYEKCVETHVRHGKHRGIPTHVLTQSLVKKGSYFNKEAYMLNLILSELAKPEQRRAEWIIWFDGDSVVLNPEIPWNIFFPPQDFDDKHILATQDDNGFNAGMLILRVHEWTANTLIEVLALHAIKPDTQLPSYDQSAMEWVCDRPGYREHFLYQPRRWWNRYYIDPDSQEVGNMLVRFAGVNAALQGSQTKLDNMTKILEKLDKEPKEWSRPVGGTTYEKEIADYWELLRRSRKLLDRSFEWKVKNEEKAIKYAEIQDAEKKLVDVLWKHTDQLDKVEELNKRLDGFLNAA